jgi:hypothetical protein
MHAIPKSDSFWVNLTSFWPEEMINKWKKVVFTEEDRSMRKLNHTVSKCACLLDQSSFRAEAFECCCQWEEHGCSALLAASI